MKYMFQLGHQPHISTAELQAVFGRDHLSIYGEAEHTRDNFWVVESKEKLDSTKILEGLGGTRKIGIHIKNIGDPIKSIAHFLHENCEGKIHFSVSGNNAKKIALAVKKELKSQGRSVRYIEPKNTATILHNNLVEKQGDFTVVTHEVFVTEAIQDIEGYTKRDYDRPGSDDISGMLPPKLARIMINVSQASKKQTLLDPFCGSGTVLTEALSLDFKNIIGSDISPKAINDTKQNIEWLTHDNLQSSNLSTLNTVLHTCNATDLHKVLSPNSIDAIITEPYLGKPLKGSESKEELLKQTQELKKIYVSSFQSFSKILKPKAVIVCVFPTFASKTGWIPTIPRKEICDIGFKVWPFAQSECLLYHRPKQYLGREIWRFKIN